MFSLSIFQPFICIRKIYNFSSHVFGLLVLKFTSYAEQVTNFPNVCKKYECIERILLIAESHKFFETNNHEVGKNNFVLLPL